MARSLGTVSEVLDAHGGPTVTDFVGRAAELGRLDRGLAQVAAGRGALVTVQGPAGIGKTALAEEVARRARRRGHAVAWGRCWEAGGAPPLWPWQPVLTDLGAPDAAALLDGDVGSSSVDPDRFARFVAVTEALAEAVGSAGACLIVDDAHHADTGALLLTRFVARSLDRIPLLLVVLRRVGDGGASGAVQTLLEEVDAEGDSIVLHHLGSAEIRNLLTRQGLVDLDPELVTAIERITGGNPLFLRRLTGFGAPSSAAGLPQGVRRAVADAVDRLDRPDQERLRLAAVLGLSPSVAETAELIGMAPGAVLDTVARAQAVGVVDHVGRGRFSFSHDLVREVLVDGLSASDLLDAHARAVEVVGGSADEPQASRLARQAHHATRAATRSTIDAAQAVGIARASARQSRTCWVDSPTYTASAARRVRSRLASASSPAGRPARARFCRARTRRHSTGVRCSLTHTPPRPSAASARRIGSPSSSAPAAARSNSDRASASRPACSTAWASSMWRAEPP